MLVMKKIFAFLVILSLFFAVSLASAEDSKKDEESSFFKLTNAYFQTEGCRPYHLMDDYTKERLSLGDKFKFWLTFDLSGKSPCDERSEIGCEMIFEIIDSKGDKRSFFTWKDRRFTGGSKFSLSVPGRISRKTAFGDAVIRTRFSKEEDLFVYDIPIEVTE